MNKNNLSNNQTSFLLYTGNDGNVNVEVFLKDDTIWSPDKLDTDEEKNVKKDQGSIYPNGRVIIYSKNVNHDGQVHTPT